METVEERIRRMTAARTAGRPGMVQAPAPAAPSADQMAANNTRPRQGWGLPQGGVPFVPPKGTDLGAIPHNPFLDIHGFNELQEQNAREANEVRERNFQHRLDEIRNPKPPAAPPATPTLGMRGTESGTTSRVAPPRPAPRMQDINAGDPHERTPPAAPAPNYRKVTSRGGHALDAEIASYDNDNGVILLRDRNGKLIPVPHEEVDDDTHAAAFNAPRYTAEEAHLGSVKAKRERVAAARAAGAKPFRDEVPQPAMVPNITKPFRAPNAPRPMVPNITKPFRAPSAPPEPKPADPHSQALGLLDDLNARRSEAGGEVPDAPQVMAEVRRLQAEGDAIRNAPGAARPAAPRPAAPKPAAKQAPPAAKPVPPAAKPDALPDGFVRAGAAIGEIASHDPESRTVKLRTPTGETIWVGVDELDEAGRREYNSRVGEHNERVAYDNEKAEFEKRWGKGTWDQRHAPENKFPELRGPDGRGGMRVAAARAAQAEQQSQEATAAHDRTMERIRNGGRKPAAAVVDAQPAQAAPIPPAARAAAEAALAEQAPKPAAQPAAQPKPPLNPVDALWKQAVASYRRQQKEFMERGVTLDEHFDELAAASGLTVKDKNGADVPAHAGHVSPSLHSTATNVTQRNANYIENEKVRRSNVRNRGLGMPARLAAAQRVLDDPTATPAQRAAAYHSIGNPELAARELASGAAVQMGKDGAAAAVAAADVRGKPGNAPPRPLHHVASEALDSVDENATVEEQTDAVAQMMLADDTTLTPERAIPVATRVVQRRAWESARQAPENSPAFSWLWRTANRLDENGDAVAKGGQTQKPMSYEEFRASAFANAQMNASDADKLYERLVAPEHRSGKPKRTAPPAETQVGIPDDGMVLGGM